LMRVRALNDLPLTTPVMGFVILSVVVVAIGLEQLTAWIWPPGVFTGCPF
jgi:hypothetical protein